MQPMPQDESKATRRSGSQKICYGCGKAVSLQELWHVDHLIETSPRLERFVEQFSQCTGGPDMFHDNGAFDYLDVVNACKACFDDINGQLADEDAAPGWHPPRRGS